MLISLQNTVDAGEEETRGKVGDDRNALGKEDKMRLNGGETQNKRTRVERPAGKA